MPLVVVVGAGLAGLACSAALAEAGLEVAVLEARPFPGGRATSYSVPSREGNAEVIDNCQHVLLRCCVNLLDFYRRLGVDGKIKFHRTFRFIEPGGRVSRFRAGLLPAPLHFTGAFLRLRFLGLSDKLAVARALLTLRREARRRSGLDEISMMDWLREKRQPPRAIDRFWRPVLVSAINEELDGMAASHGFQVMRLGFLSSRRGYQMGLSTAPLGELYAAELWRRFPRVRFRFREPVRRLLIEDGRVHGVECDRRILFADYYVLAVPFEQVSSLAPELGFDAREWTHSPITGIHLWFDRRVTNLPHAVLLDRTIQWFFNKSDGRYLQLVVSASRSLLPMSKAEVVGLALKELAEFLPEVRDARLEKARVVKEVRATFAARPGLEALRPAAATRLPNLFLAGDWTRSGWPATMEGAVRSGYSAAEAVTAAAGEPRRFLLPDIA